MSPLLLGLVLFGAACLLGAYLYQNTSLFRRKKRRLPPVPLMPAEALAESAPAPPRNAALRKRATVNSALTASTPNAVSDKKEQKQREDAPRRGSEGGEGGHDGEPYKTDANGKKRSLTKEEKRAKREIFKQKAQEKKQRKKEREEKELKRLREEIRQEKERIAEEKRLEDAEKERKRREEEERINAEKEKIKEEKRLEKDREMEEERRRMVEEEKERARQAEIDRLKPALAWGGAAAKQVLSGNAISISETLNRADKSDDTERSTQARNKVREERRKHRKLLLETREKERALLEAESVKNGSKKQGNDEIEESVSEETRTVAEEEKAKLTYTDTLAMDVDRAGTTARVHGVPESAHAFVIGENGANIAILRLIGAKVFLAETITMEGYHEDLDSAFLKLKVLMQWKHFADINKKYRNGKGHKALVAEWARRIASDLCFRYHNEGFGKCRLDLTGLADDEALNRFTARMDEIERIPIASLPSDSLEIIIGVPRALASSSGPPSLPVERAVCEYLMDFRFTHKVSDGKGSRIVRVQL